jgi:hypothetical protein
MTLLVFSIVLIVFGMFVLPQILPAIATPITYLGYAGLAIYVVGMLTGKKTPGLTLRTPK